MNYLNFTVGTIPISHFYTEPKDDDWFDNYCPTCTRKLEVCPCDQD